MDLNHPKFPIAGVVGAMVVITALGYDTVTRLRDHFNLRSCEQDTVQKQINREIPSNGHSGYDKETQKCFYKFTNAEGLPDNLIWEP